MAVGRDASACLLPPAALPAATAEHLVSVRHDAQVDHFVGRLHVGPRRLELAASSLMGMPLFSIRFDGQAVRFEPKTMRLPANLVVLVLEAALADPARLQPRLHGLTLKVTRSDGMEIRTLTEHGHLVARIQRSASPLPQARLVIDLAPIHTVLRLDPLPEAR